MEISGAIFDLDGTLVDSMSFYLPAGKSCLEKFGLENHPELVKLFLSKTSQELAVIFRTQFGIKKSEEQIASGINSEFYDLYARKISSKEGAGEFLEFLKSKNVRISLLTASDREIVFPCLKRNRLFDFFDEFVFCSEQRTSKRNPEIFGFTARLLGCAAENSFVFEDALYSIETAKKAGFKICGIYDSWCSGDWEKIKKESDVYGKNFDEIKLKFENLKT